MTTRRITPDMKPADGLKILREPRGYFITNAARDQSQSEFENRILPHTDFLVAALRDRAGYFSLDAITGTSVHNELLRKHCNPFERLKLLKAKMPDTLLQGLCRGLNLFGYHTYPENIVRETVKAFAEYIDVWKVYDFLNCVPNMAPVFEEVLRIGKYLQPCICFSTGPEYTEEYFVSKAAEIIQVTGEDIILGLKNPAGLGTPRKIYDTVRSLKKEFPNVPLQYHGHNTDGNEIGRTVAAVFAGAKIVDGGDHAMTGFFGPPSILTLVDALAGENYEAIGLDREAVIETSEQLKTARQSYSAFEPLMKGFDPTVQIHKLPGGMIQDFFKQAMRGEFPEKLSDILMKEMPRLQVELGNFPCVFPGSQIYWGAAIDNMTSYKRYQNATEDLRNYLLGKYGAFPFRKPDDEIYHTVFGADWKKQVEREGGREAPAAVDFDVEKRNLERSIGRKATHEEAVLHLMYPRDAIEYFKFEEEYGKAWVLPPEVWYKTGGFEPGQKIAFEDYTGKYHKIVVGPSHDDENGGSLIHLSLDNHQLPFSFKPEVKIKAQEIDKRKLTPSEISVLADKGEIRAITGGVIVEIMIKPGDHVERGDLLLTLESMKMVNRIVSPVTGVVKGIFVKPSQEVALGDMLVQIKFIDLSQIF